MRDARLSCVNFSPPLFSSCVESQPGLIQLLLGVKSDVSVVVRAAPLSDKESVDNESVDLVGESGCLSTVLDLLKEMAGKEDEQEQTSYTLHVALVRTKSSFIYLSIFFVGLAINRSIVLFASYSKPIPQFFRCFSNVKVCGEMSYWLVTSLSNLTKSILL